MRRLGMEENEYWDKRRGRIGRGEEKSIDDRSEVYKGMSGIGDEYSIICII